jgi:hypothetical protein
VDVRNIVCRYIWITDHFRNTDGFKYSFTYILISLFGLVFVTEIEPGRG